MPTIVDAKFEQWKARLLDLSKRNRLLFFKQVRRGNVQIIEPSVDEIFDWLVRNTKKLVFARQTDLSLQSHLENEADQHGQESNFREVKLKPGEIRTGLSDQQLTITLYNIRLKARSALQEQGVNVLYLAFGILKWYETNASTEEIQSPLILVPVEMDRASIAKSYTLELLDEDILLNPTLSYRMQRDYGFSFPQMPEDWEANNPAQVLAQIEQLIKNQPRWAILPQVHLGLFSFEKLVMLRDLESHAQQAKEHPVISGIAGDLAKTVVVPSDIPSGEQLDQVSPQDTFQILDADSSQQEAIALAKRDVSFVIQGPPGTGKSQTIANIIAERLAQGKKILFVSEKMAALEVVYKRLHENGLDEFCLEAHSHKGSKGIVIAQLGRALNSALPTSSASFEAELKQVADERTRLNDYVTALHTPRTPLRKTVFQIHGLLAALYDTPDATFPVINVSRIDADELGQFERALDRLVATSEVWDKQGTHLWRDTLVQDFSFHTQSEIRDHFGEFIKCLDRLEAIASDLAQEIGLKSAKNLLGARSLAEIAGLVVKTPFPPIAWFENRNVALLRQSAIKAQAVYADYVSNSHKLSAHYSSALIEQADLPELVSRFENMYRGVFRILSPNYRRDMERIQAHSVMYQKLGYEKTLQVLRLAQHAREKKEWMDAQRAEHQQLFGDLFQGLTTQWDAILSALDWADRLMNCLREKDSNDLLLDLVCHKSNRIDAVRHTTTVLQAVLDKTEREVAFWGRVFPLDRIRIDRVKFEEATFDQLREFTQFRLNHLADLSKWINHQLVCKDCEQQGLGLFLEAARREGIPSGKLSSAFHKRFYQMWIDSVYARDPILSSFDSVQHAKLIEHFRKVDSAQVGYARKRLVAKLAMLRPQSSWMDAPSSEVTILRRELEKKKRHKPIRRLFAEISNLLLTLKPCLMMSPLSVSQFLSAGTFEFDTIIFDEASQICPEDAISAMMRGKQVIVAGDRNQLPPTLFFRSLGIEYDEWDEEENGAEILQSVLQECAVFMPSQMLKWHYRSRRESLIAFSNHHVYDDQLITFPSPQLDGDQLGIEFVHTPEGVYDRGKTRKNRGEAHRVAELVYRHFVEFGHQRSLGIVAFSEAQREAIDEEIERLASTETTFEAFLNQKGIESFFVKNLENVQGDERDVIYFSMGYGKDALGKLTLNFGPLNGEDGVRRLNVAMTRARYHVKFISSILPEDIDADIPNKGVQLLRRYMRYAQQRGNRKALHGKTDSLPNEDSNSPFETVVSLALTEQGLAVHKKVGCSDYRIDLAIVDHERFGHYVLGIESDGATYYSAKTARDRDRLRHQILEGLGWRIYRVWSRDWIADPHAQVQKILKAIELAKESSHPFQPFSSQFLLPESLDNKATRAPGIDTAPSQNSADGGIGLPQGVMTYASFLPPKLGEPEQFYRSDQEIKMVLTQVVELEGPIHMDGACRRVAECWGISKMGNRIKSQIADAAYALAEEKRIQIRDQFLWLSQSQLLVRRPPIGEIPRPIEEIAIEEIAQATYFCLCDAFSLSQEDLITMTSRLLGYERVSERVRERILLAIEQLIAHQLVHGTDQKIELVHKRV